MWSGNLRGITVRQPWAWAIASGWKTVENRSWLIDYRGPVAIHTAAGVGTRWEFDRACERVATRVGLTTGMVAQLAAARGVVLAVAQLDDICSDSRCYGHTSPLHCDCGPWAMSGDRHFKLTDVRQLADPVPVKGMLGLWRLPEDAETAIRRQSADAAVS